MSAKVIIPRVSSWQFMSVEGLATTTGPDVEQAYPLGCDHLVAGPDPGLREALSSRFQKLRLEDVSFAIGSLRVSALLLFSSAKDMNFWNSLKTSSETNHPVQSRTKKKYAISCPPIASITCRASRGQRLNVQGVRTLPWGR